MNDGLARLRRCVLLALQHLDEVAGGLQRVARQQRRPLVVHGYGDLPDAGGLLEGRGSTVAVRHPAANGLLVKIWLDYDGICKLLFLLVCLVLRRDDR